MLTKRIPWYQKTFYSSYAGTNWGATTSTTCTYYFFAWHWDHYCPTLSAGSRFEVMIHTEYVSQTISPAPSHQVEAVLWCWPVINVRETMSEENLQTSHNRITGDLSTDLNGSRAIGATIKEVFHNLQTNNSSAHINGVYHFIVCQHQLSV